MKTLVQTTLILGLCLGGLVPGHAQWPLGRDLPQGITKTEPGPAITIAGRFQMFTSPHIKGHTFMLDTDTGRVWIMKKDHTSGDFLLQRVPVEEVDAKAGGASAPDKKKDEQK